MSFEKIIGNDKVKELLNKNVKSQNLLHSYMFIGPNGIGKNMIAHDFAKMILCMSETNKPCDVCKSCEEINGNNNPDFFEISSDGKIIKIDQIRQMQEKIIEKPLNSGKKVYIINDADLMTKEAQNCLLKTLEEPPEYIVIILIVSNESKILTTIKSRCMKIAFQKIQDSDIKVYLEKKCGIQTITNNMLKMCDGSIGKAEELKEKIEQYQEIENIFLKIESYNKLELLKNAEILYKNKEEIINLLDYINVVLYDCSCKNIEKSIQYINSIKIVEKTKAKIIANSNYDMSIDNLLLSIWEEINEKHCRS